MKLNFLGGEYQSSSLPISAQESVNCFLEIGSQATNPAVVRGTPGIIEFVDLPDPVRALHEAYGQLYGVAGSYAYRISAAGEITQLGLLIDDGQPASIVENVNEILFVSAGKGYTLQRGAGSIVPVSDAEFPNTSIAKFLDGYALLLEKDSGRFWWSDISDFESVSGIDFATAEGAPDNLVSLEVDHREIWLFGTRTTEIWYNDGSSPFSRAPGGFIERGCGGTYTPAKVDNSVFWLGEDGAVYRADQMAPTRVSNHGIETLLEDVTLSDGIGFGYQQGGHSFYVLTFPGALTVTYDAATTYWHVRKHETDAGYKHHAFAYGNHLVGGDKIYKVDPSSYQFDGGEMIRTRAIGPLRTDGFTTMNELIVVVETGGGEYDSDAQLMLRISDDAGVNWSGPIYAPLGRKGQYATEVKYTALGGFYDNERVLSLSMSDNAPFVIVDLRVQ